jgi:malate synthase
VTAADLLAVPDGQRTASGMRTNIRVSIQYIEAWLSGTGAVAIHDLMEDAATAEISRASIWQWIQHGAVLNDGTRVTKELVRQTLAEELESLHQEVGDARFAAGKYVEAARVMDEMTTGDDFADFLTLPAYEML